MYRTLRACLRPPNTRAYVRFSSFFIDKSYTLDPSGKDVVQEKKRKGKKKKNPFRNERDSTQTGHKRIKRSAVLITYIA